MPGDHPRVEMNVRIQLGMAVASPDVSDDGRALVEAVSHHYLAAPHSMTVPLQCRYAGSRQRLLHSDVYHLLHVFMTRL